ncbi:DUF3231 family protein [Lentibacillus sp. CBA3610]|uniref:DUF3231 family protein n=1 Tax=Lentibacillus sp. CBA3610 TaxID=2518176 RepID=UPI0015963CAB|nr:DUF3231 family protein [Lentibacillus sp. CBA3610]QKY70613.1 DUF3231 family protein [Lentibacillus sp. CBA3610]
MDKNDLKLTSAEIGTLWSEYVNGSAINIVNKYMSSIIEDQQIKMLFDEAIQIFEGQKRQIETFIRNEGFPVPIGFTETDLIGGAKRLFSDIFCLHYLHIMTSHGLLGHISGLQASTRKDLREFYDACDNEGKMLYHKTTDLLLEKGHFQRDPYIYPEGNPQFVSGQQFLSSFFGKNRPLSAMELVNLTFNIKKKITAKTLSIGFSQVARSTEVRKFLKHAQKTSDQQIQSLSTILHDDSLPIPMSWESEITTSQESPFSDKLLLYHIGFLFQTSQAYHGASIATAMRTDLLMAYEKIIFKNIMVTKEWFNLMTKNKWFEQPPLAPDRQNIARNR